MPTYYGKIRAWIETRAFGFVVPSDGSDELFFHRKDLRGEARDEGGLGEGDTVQYEKGWDERNSKGKATNIHLVKSASIEDKVEALAARRERERNPLPKRKSPSPAAAASQTRRSPSTHKRRGQSRKRRRRSTSRSKSSGRERRRRRRSGSRDRGRRRRRSSPSPKVEEVGERSREAPVMVREIETFADFVRVAPVVQKHASKMLTIDLTQLCLKAAQVKFYDGEMLDVAIQQLKSRFASKGEDCFGPERIVTVLGALADLNAYNKEFFNCCARVLAKQTDRLTSVQVKGALRAFRATKHEGDDELIDNLARKTKQNNYEAAKHELFQRQLKSMYGDTRDLQGAPMDTERALLKKPRSSVTY